MLHLPYSVFGEVLCGKRELGSLAVDPILRLLQSVLFISAHMDTLTLNSSNPLAISGTSFNASVTIIGWLTSYIEPNSETTAFSNDSFSNPMFVIGEPTLSTPLALMKA